MQDSQLKTRSRKTNQPHRVAGFDGRTTEGRRRRDLIDGYAAAMGGMGRVSAAQMVDIARAADLVIIAEQARGKALRGAEVDLGDLTRLEGAADRAVRRLGIKPGANAPKPMSLADYLAAKQAEKAASAVDNGAA
jgi:hypothetical protein